MDRLPRPGSRRAFGLSRETIAKMCNLEHRDVALIDRAELDMAAYGLPDWPIMQAARH